MEKVLWLIERVKSGLWNFVLDFSLDDAPQSGRPAEVDSDQIKPLIENNQCYTIQERANILKISKSIKLLVKMKSVSFIFGKKPYGRFGQPNKK